MAGLGQHANRGPAGRTLRGSYPRSGRKLLERVRASRAKAAWARLIRKVYEAEPLECLKCKGPMRVIALIEDPAVVQAILTHLGRWQPKALERAPPVSLEAWPAHASLPLRYQSVPEIA